MILEKLQHFCTDLGQEYSLHFHGKLTTNKWFRLPEQTFVIMMSEEAYHMYHKYHHFFVMLSICCLLFLMTACSLFPSSPTTGNTPTVGTTQGKTPTSTGGTSTATTATIPPTQNTCPAAGTARAAVTAPLALGTHQAIVYIFNQGTQGAPTSGIIRRFDARTGLKTDIVNIPGSLIYEAQISANGQWILFTSKMAGQMTLQMVRMDGKGI